MIIKDDKALELVNELMEKYKARMQELVSGDESILEFIDLNLLVPMDTGEKISNDFIEGFCVGLGKSLKNPENITEIRQIIKNVQALFMIEVIETLES